MFFFDFGGVRLVGFAQLGVSDAGQNCPRSLGLAGSCFFVSGSDRLCGLLSLKTAPEGLTIARGRGLRAA